MLHETPRELFLASLARCSRSDEFVPAFYRRLLASDEEVRARFRFTNMEDQHEKLRESLELCAAVTAGEPEALAHLRAIGRLHDADHLDIHPEWYSAWIEAMLATAAEFDGLWDTESADAWRRLLTVVTGRLASFYNPPDHPVAIDTNDGWGPRAN